MHTHIIRKATSITAAAGVAAVLLTMEAAVVTTVAEALTMEAVVTSVEEAAAEAVVDVNLNKLNTLYIVNKTVIFSFCNYSCLGTEGVAHEQSAAYFTHLST